MLVVEGARVRSLITTLTSEHLVGLHGELSGASVFAYGWDQGEQPASRAGQGRGAGIMQFIRAQREPLSLGGKFKPVPLAVSPAAAKKLDRLRKAMAQSEE